MLFNVATCSSAHTISCELLLCIVQYSISKSSFVRFFALNHSRFSDFLKRLRCFSYDFQMEEKQYQLINSFSFCLLCIEPVYRNALLTTILRDYVYRNYSYRSTVFYPMLFLNQFWQKCCPFSHQYFVSHSITFRKAIEYKMQETLQQ